MTRFLKLLAWVAGVAGPVLATFAGKLGVSSAIKFATSLAFPGWGALGSMLLSAGRAFLAFLWDQAGKVLADCIKNPRVFIAIGVALAAGNWYGWGNGFKQGEGDLETYRQEAVVYQKQADATAADASAAKAAAMKAEAAKIATEKAKADSDAKAKKAADELIATKAKAASEVKALTIAKAAAEKAAAAAKKLFRKKANPSTSSTEKDWSLGTIVSRS